MNNSFFDKIYNNTLLEGLRYNNEEYYCARDITGCIDIIIDKNKKEMVLYRYTSYGEVEAYINPSLTSSEIEIANVLMNNNGFVYKGYYYDSEIRLFYCNSRYYNPEWCRWISPDDIEYLDPESVNGLNLHCYCLNDPVNNVDPTGHFAIISFLISVGISAAISIAKEAIEDGKDGQFFNDKDLMDYIGAGFGGAISGMAGNVATAFLLGGIGSMIETAFSGEATSDNMISTFLSGALGGLVGYGIGEVAKYAASFLQVGAGKFISKFVSKKTVNNTINKMFARMGATGTKIGSKNIKGIVWSLAKAEKNYFAVTVSSFVSGWI